MYSFPITKAQYNYLLPVFGLSSNNPKLLYKQGSCKDYYYFIGSHEEHKDALNRCKYL